MTDIIDNLSYIHVAAVAIKIFLFICIVYFLSFEKYEGTGVYGLFFIVSWIIARFLIYKRFKK